VYTDVGASMGGAAGGWIVMVERLRCRVVGADKAREDLPTR
jgi:hypothetical protein